MLNLFLKKACRKYSVVRIILNLVKLFSLFKMFHVLIIIFLLYWNKSYSYLCMQTFLDVAPQLGNLPPAATAIKNVR